MLNRFIKIYHGIGIKGIMIFTDAPIENKKDDLLGRSGFIKQLAKSILNWPVEKSTVIGLLGPWGSGKTSLINLLEEYIKNTSNKKPVIIRFNPWNFSGQDHLISMFFQELKTDLKDSDTSKNSKELIKKITTYSSFLDPLSSIPQVKSSVLNIKRSLGKLYKSKKPYLKKANNAIKGKVLSKKNISNCIRSLGHFSAWSPPVKNYFSFMERIMTEWGDSPNPSFNLDQIKDEINALIQNRGRKIIVIIDDIDRLMAREIRQIFKLIKLSADFKNTIYITAFAPNIVEKALTQNGIFGNEYLQKIIQHHINIPAIEQTDIDKFLYLSDHPFPKNTIGELKNLTHGKKISLKGKVVSVAKSKITIGDHEGEEKIEILLPSEMDTDNLRIERASLVYIEGVLNKIDNSILIRIENNDHIKKYYISQIDQIFQNLGISHERINQFDEVFRSIYLTYIRNLFPTLRQAKRYVNSLLFDLPQVKDEISLFDFLTLQVIKISASDIYNDISQNWWIYVDQRFEHEIWSSPFTLKYLTKEAEMIKQIVKQHVGELIDKSDVGRKNKGIFIELLCNLFPRVSEAYNRHYQYQGRDNGRAKKRIYSTCFCKYFTLKPALTLDIPDALVEDIIKIWNKSDPKKSEEVITKTFLEFQKNKRIRQFLIKLSIFFGNISPEKGVYIIRSIYNNIHVFSDDNSWDSEYRKAEDLILNIIDRKTEKDQIQPLLEKIVTSVTSLEFTTSIVTWSKGKDSGRYFNIYENVNINKLEELVFKRFKERFIDDKRDIFKEEPKWALVILDRCSKYDKSKKDILNKYVFSLIDKHPEYICKVINYFATFWGRVEGDPSIHYDDLSEIYDVHKLYGLIKKKGEKLYSTEKEKLAIQSFIKAYNQKHTKKPANLP